YIDTRLSAVIDLESVTAGSSKEMIFGIYDNPDDVGIILEGVQVLDDLGNVPFAVAMLFALVCALNLSYPSELRYTLEALQKIIMELDGNRLSRKAQALKTLLSRT
uniref:Uncharacterized protein n=1 Tax=Labrus bergylta TaxID=56723 RepID=A0A3Q3FF03_9LABR